MARTMYICLSMCNGKSSDDKIESKKLPLETENTPKNENWQLDFIEPLHMQLFRMDAIRIYIRNPVALKMNAIIEKWLA